MTITVQHYVLPSYLLQVFTALTFSIYGFNAQNGLGNIAKYEQWDRAPEESPFKKCHNSSPPVPEFDYRAQIPEYVINLDDPPDERWTKLATDMKYQIRRFMDGMRNHTDKIFGTEVFRLVDAYLPLLSKSLPSEYYNELISIAKGTDLPLGEVTLFNVFYEFHSLCTSIIMEDSSGTMHHGRNLDFGFLLGWDVENKTWLVSELLRPLVVKVHFLRDSQILYTSVSFAGYIGVLTGVKKNAFSLSVNERMKLNGGLVGLVEWILGRRDQKWNGILTREILENAASYKEAEKMLSSSKLVAPTYFILTGVKSGQGSVITRGRNDADIWRMNAGRKTSTWHLVQTNYDHWKKPPPFDNRRVPAIICLELLGQQNASYTLYNVLSTPPILNKMTIYSAIMEPVFGDSEVWIQDCQSCWPW